MERLEWKIDYNYEDIKEKILGLEQKANECIMQKGKNLELTNELFYFMSSVDKSIKLIDSVLEALENGNITVLSILTRVQIDCMCRTYALMLVDDRNKFAEKVMLKGKKINNLKDRDGQQLRDKYLCEQVGQHFGLPVYDIYSEVSGYVHFSNESFKQIITDVRDNGISLSFFRRNNPEENEEACKEYAILLANYYYAFANILISNIFDEWVKQCLNELLFSD